MCKKTPKNKTNPPPKQTKNCPKNPKSYQACKTLPFDMEIKIWLKYFHVQSLLLLATTFYTWLGELELLS